MSLLSKPQQKEKERMVQKEADRKRLEHVKQNIHKMKVMEDMNAGILEAQHEALESSIDRLARLRNSEGVDDPLSQNDKFDSKKLNSGNPITHQKKREKNSRGRLLSNLKNSSPDHAQLDKYVELRNKTDNPNRVSTGEAPVIDRGDILAIVKKESEDFEDLAKAGKSVNSRNLGLSGDKEIIDRINQKEEAQKNDAGTLHFRKDGGRKAVRVENEQEQSLVIQAIAHNPTKHAKPGVIAKLALAHGHPIAHMDTVLAMTRMAMVHSAQTRRMNQIARLNWVVFEDNLHKEALISSNLEENMIEDSNEGEHEKSVKLMRLQNTRNKLMDQRFCSQTFEENYLFTLPTNTISDAASYVEARKVYGSVSGNASLSGILGDLDGTNSITNGVSVTKNSSSSALSTQNSTQNNSGFFAGKLNDNLCNMGLKAAWANMSKEIQVSVHKKLLNPMSSVKFRTLRNAIVGILGKEACELFNISQRGYWADYFAHQRAQMFDFKSEIKRSMRTNRGTLVLRKKMKLAKVMRAFGGSGISGMLSLKKSAGSNNSDGASSVGGMSSNTERTNKSSKEKEKTDEADTSIKNKLANLFGKKKNKANDDDLDDDAKLRKSVEEAEAVAQIEEQDEDDDYEFDPDAPTTNKPSNKLGPEINSF